MALPDRHLLFGMTLGAICATALSAIGPGWVVAALASDTGVSIDPASLVRIGDEMFDITYEGWVATDPVSNASVRKIGYGRSELVHIATTATGTYSSDGFSSPQVSYPGIEVEPVAAGASILVYGSNGAWIAAPVGNRPIQRVPLSEDQRLVTFGNMVCSVSNSFVVC